MESLESSNSGWIEELATNNQFPSEEAVQEIKRLLIKPVKDLEVMDAEILNLRNRLSELESKRNETQKRISRWTLILSPIRRVPSDVLAEIFYHCLPTHRNPIMKSTEGPLLLTHVCGSWRAVAISSPRLWERLYITFTDDDTVPDLESAAAMVRSGEITAAGWQHALSQPAKERRIETLRKRYDAVKKWLSRSGTRPLSLSISFTCRIWYPVPYSERPTSVGMEILSFLAKLSPRIKDFEIQASPTIYNILEQLISIPEMTALTSLRLSYPSQFLTYSETNSTVALMQAPNLQQLSILANDPRVWAMPSACRWDKLTKLSCGDSLTVHETIFLLENSSNLIHYKGIISEYSAHDDDPFVYEGHISLQFLQSLCLSEYVNPDRIGNLYDRIDAPSLQSIIYSSHFYSLPGEFRAANPAPISILPLLRKSTELKKLSLDTSDFTVWDLGSVLSVVPSITHLVIGPIKKVGSVGEDSMLPSTIYVPPDYDSYGVSNSQSWGFANLVVGQPSEATDESESTLLPNLTSLTISSPTAIINDDLIFDIVKSRMSPTIRSAALQHVKVRIYKERSRDIVQELHRYAESAGVKIKLDIEHAPPPPPDRDPISVEYGLNYGLNGPAGRTWPYIDAGEDP